MDTDEYGQVINGPSTYGEAAAILRNSQPVVLNWADQRGSLLNVLLTYDPVRIGAPGGKVDTAPRKLWIGVAGMGMFAFPAGDDVHPDYVAEKIGLAGATAAELTELIVGVGEALA